MTSPIAKPDDEKGGKALIERLKNASSPDQNGCRLFTADLTREAAEALTASSERIRVLEQLAEHRAAERYNAYEDAARLCEKEADDCMSDIVPGDDVGAREAKARAGALLAAAHDIRQLIVSDKPHIAKSTGPAQ